MAADIYWLTGEAFSEGEGLTSLFDADLLSVQERARLEGMRFPKRRADWLSGRRAAKELLRRCEPGLADLSFDQITISNRAGGAPEVRVNGAVYPGRLTISHSHERALAAWTRAPGAALGADIERVEPRAEVFVADFFTAQEQAAVAQAKSGQRDLLVTLIWSAKEAVLKALGIGLGVDTRRVEVMPGEERNGSGWGRFEIRARLAENQPWQAYWRADGQYVITVAAAGAVGQLRLVEMGAGIMR